MFTTPAEFQEFKNIIYDLLKELDLPITLNEVCTAFRQKRGVDFKRWFKHNDRAIPKASHLFQSYLADITELDTKSRPPDILVHLKGGISTKIEKSFKHELNIWSQSDFEQSLQTSLKKHQGTSKENAITIKDSNNQHQQASSSSGKERAPNLPGHLDMAEFVDLKEQIFSFTSEFKEMKSDVAKFHKYRDYQMLHIAYVKLRVLTLFSHTGLTKMHFHTIGLLFKKLFNENFFQTPVLKHYVTSGVDRDDNIKTFLKRFCGDFLFVNDESEASICRSTSTLMSQFLSAFLKAVEKLKEGHLNQQQLSRTISPQSQQRMIMGRITADNVTVDVRRSTEHTRFGGGPSNPNVGINFLDFPGLVDGHFPARRPTMIEVNECVNEIRNRICKEHRPVIVAEVIHELCKIFNVASIKDLRPAESREIRRESDIPALQNLMRLHGKVAALAQSFVTFRNICTLHELEEEICKMESTQSFDHLKLGPLQKQLIVHDLFQFPPERPDIPPITTYDIFRLMWKCYDNKYKQEKQTVRMPDGSMTGGKDFHVKIMLPEFMEFVRTTYGFNKAVESGLRINNVGYALQATRKSWFSDMHNMKRVGQRFRDSVTEDFLNQLEFAKRKTLGASNNAEDDSEGGSLYNKIANMPILDALNASYELLQTLKLEACKTLPATANLVNFSDITMNALAIIQKDKFMRSVFHTVLSIAPLKVLGKDDVKILKYLGLKAAMEEADKDVEKTKKVSSEKKNEIRQTSISKSQTITVVKKWLSRSINIDVKDLSKVEQQIITELDPEATVFESFGHGSFLKFITNESEIFELLKFSMSASSTMFGSNFTKEELVSFLKQCQEENNKESIMRSAELQFNSKFQFSDIDVLLKDSCQNPSSKKQQHQQQETSQLSGVLFQHTFLCSSDFHKDTQDKSRRNRLTQLSLKRIQEAPCCVDIAECINWNIMFGATLGTLKDFLRNNKAKFKNAPYSILQLSGNERYAKVLKHCSLDELKTALNDLDPLRTSSCMLSLLISSLSIKNAPLSLLANQMQNALMEKAGKSYQAHSENMQRILHFTLECFRLLPFEILCCIARKIFITRLGALLGTQKVPGLLLQAAMKKPQHRRVLHGLGYHLSVSEWIKDAESYKMDEVVESYQHILNNNQEKTENTTANESHAKEVKKEKDNKDVKKKIRITEPLSDGELPDSDEEGLEEVEIDEKNFSKRNIKTETAVEQQATGTAAVDNQNDEHRIKYCKDFVEALRHDQFGIGVQIDEKSQKLLDIHREREGRSLNRLSTELYTKDSHFVLELIQNADDNEYHVHTTTSGGDGDSAKIEVPSCIPAVAFVVEADRVIIHNNETGFTERHVRALCDIGKSTKGIHRKGYIGQKGIGFKSVFRVTNRPEIHSNGFHIKFDSTSGPNGYILPQWIDELDEKSVLNTTEYNNDNSSSSSWMTKIVLPLKKELQHVKLTSRFHDIHPSLLLFLNRLCTIVIDDKVSGVMKRMSKEVLDKHMVRLTENDVSSLWFIVSKEIPVQMNGETKHTIISVAFPLTGKDTRDCFAVQPIFAYLPLRSYGFKFIIQADFEVPSSREDIDIDSAWNQCILHYIPELVAEALVQFKEHAYFEGCQGNVEYFKFMDMEEHVLGTFRQVARNIITCLQRVRSMPAEDDHGNITWQLPSSVILCTEGLRLMVSANVLYKHLGLHFIAVDIQSKIPVNVLNSLGVSRISVGQLIELAKAVLNNHHHHHNDNDEHQVDTAVKGIDELYHWIGQWFAVLFTTLQEECDYSEETVQTIRSLKLFALCDGSLVSLQDEVVFFAVDSNAKTRKVYDPLNIIEKDLRILSRGIYSNLDQIQQQQVKRLLNDVGVKSMTPSDLITNHIVPFFKDGHWKNKDDKLIVACVCYLRQQLADDCDLLSVDDLRTYVVLKTNKGLKLPHEENVYLPCEYGNTIDLQKTFAGCDWTCVSGDYLSGHSSTERKAWFEFFSALGLYTFIEPRKTKIHLDRSSMMKSAWKELSSGWPPVGDCIYIVEDLQALEFERLLSSKDEIQITTFVYALNDDWRKRFEKYKFDSPNCLVKDSKGNVLTTTHSSFYLKMRSAKWFPSSMEENELFVPCDLYQRTNAVERILADTVDYVSPKVRNVNFLTVLGVEAKVEVAKFLEHFKGWSNQCTFSTTQAHIHYVYDYFKEILATNPQLLEELTQNDCIFLPKQYEVSDYQKSSKKLKGKFFSMKDVCWEDPSDVIKNSTDGYGTRRVLKGFYPNAYCDFFVKTLGVPPSPTTIEYLNAVFNLVNRTLLPDRSASRQLFKMFQVLGQKCCIQDKLEELSDWGLPQHAGERCIMYHSLESYVDQDMVKILRSEENVKLRLLPANSIQFKSLLDGPVLSIDRTVRHVYEKSQQLDLVLLDDISNVFQPDQSMPSYLQRSKERETEKIMLFSLLFYRACGLQLLTDLQCKPEIMAIPIASNVVGCRFWQVLLHKTTPAIQRYICRIFPKHYLKMNEEKFAEKLSATEIVIVDALQIVHKLSDRPDRMAVRKQRICLVMDAERENKCVVYILKNYVSGQHHSEMIIKELMGIFVGEDEEKREKLLEFVLAYTTVVKKEAFLQRKQILHLSDNEQIWVYPLPKEPTPPSEEVKEHENSTPVVDKAIVFSLSQEPTEGPPRKKIKMTIDRKENLDAEQQSRPVATQQQKQQQSQQELKQMQQREQQSEKESSQHFEEEPGNKGPDTVTKPGCKDIVEYVNKSNDVISSADNGAGLAAFAGVEDVLKKRANLAKLSEWFVGYTYAQHQQHDNLAIDPNLTTKTPFSRPVIDVTDHYQEVDFTTSNKAGAKSQIFIQNMIKAKDPSGRIGQLGESLVYEHLCREYEQELQDGLVQIDWLNETKEHWLPYDMKLTFFDQRQPPIVYVEVKTSFLEEKKEFEISANQIKFAFEQGARFHLYRLTGVADVDTLKLKRLSNLATHIESKSVKLFMIL